MSTRSIHVTAGWWLSVMLVLVLIPGPVVAKAKATVDGQLVFVADCGDVAKAKSAEQKSADINFRNVLALTSAIYEGRLDVVRFLLDQGIDVNAVTTYTFSPYNPKDPRAVESHIYSQSELEGIARRRSLVKEGHRDVFRIRTIGIALIQAARLGHPDVVRFLLDRGANSEEAGFAMKWAALEGHMDIARFLLEKGAAIDARRDDGRTALMEFSRTGRSNMVSILLNGGADVDMQDECGASALTLAAETGHVKVVQMLVNSGADVNAQDCFGLTALMRAAKKGDVSIAEILLEKGANLELRSMYGWTAVAWAAFQGDSLVVKALVNKGADINMKTKHGWTPLMLAVFKGHADVVSLLLDKGVYLHARNAGGWTARDYAIAAKRFQIAALIDKSDSGE